MAGFGLFGNVESPIDNYSLIDRVLQVYSKREKQWLDYVY